MRAAKRRSFIRAVGVGSTALLSDGAMEAADLADIVRTSDLPRHTVGEIHAQVEQLVRAFSHAPAAAFETELLECRAQVRALLRRKIALSERNELTVDAARLNGLLGGVSNNLGRPADAHVYLGAAHVLAEEAGHSDLVAWTHATMARFAAQEARPGEALRHVSEGLRYASSPGTQLRLVCQGEAWAQAQKGNAEGAKDALRRAERLAIRVGDGSDPNLTFDFDPVHLPYCAALVYARLGNEPERAREQAEHALEAYQAQDLWPRSQLATQLDLAAAYAQGNEPDAACGLATSTLDAMPLSSTGIFVRIRVLERALRPYQDHPAVRDLRERIAVWKRTGSPGQVIGG